jgi:ubiquinone/menaquinone biosynthesis C-methylase UbiE
MRSPTPPPENSARGESRAVEMSSSETYLVDGRPLSAEQCRALFGAMSLSDRQAKVLDRIEGDTVIDIGCYSGLFVHEASRRFPAKSIIGVDYSDDLIRMARLIYPNVQDRFRQMSIYALDFADESVDCITLQEVLEHLEGAALAVKEINRVFRQGGVLVVSVPNPFYLWRIVSFAGREIGNTLRRWRGVSARLGTEVICKDTEWDRHVYGWTPETLLTLLATNGFEYVDHCYETRTPDRLRRWLLAVLPFFGPTIILKVRKVAPAPEKLV